MFFGLAMLIAYSKRLVPSDYVGHWPPTVAGRRAGVVTNRRGATLQKRTQLNHRVGSEQFSQSRNLGIAVGKPDPALAERYEAIWNSGQALKLLANGQVPDALRFLNAHPAGSAQSAFASVYADIYLRMDEPRKALAVLAPFVTQAGARWRPRAASGDDRILLQFSLAASLCREAYTGQADFVRLWLRAGWIGGEWDTPECLPTGDNYGGLVAMSAIALSALASSDRDDFGAFYYGHLALAYAPENAIAAADVAGVASRHGAIGLYYKVLDAAKPNALGKLKTLYDGWLSMEDWWKAGRIKPIDPHDPLFGNPALRKKITPVDAKASERNPTARP